LRHQTLPTNGHDMYAVADIFILNLPYHSTRYGDSRLKCLSLGRAGKLTDQLVWNDDAGDVGIHVSRHTGSGEKYDSGQNLHLKLAGITHEFREIIQIIDSLGLDKVYTRSYLLFELEQLRLNGIRLRSDDGTNAESCRSIEFIARNILSLPHRLHCLDQMHRIEIEDRLGVGMVSNADIIASETENIMHPRMLALSNSD